MSISLHQAIEKFLHHLVTFDKSAETIKSYSKDLYNFERYLNNKHNYPMYIDEIEKEDIEDYLYYLKQKNLQTATRSRNLYTLRSFWNYAYKNNLCTANKALSIEPIKIQKKERTYLSHDEFIKLLDTIKHPLIKIVIQTLYYTGLRISECLNLEVKDVNIEKHIIHVISGKGNKNRDIPINETLLQLLKHYIQYERPKVNSNYFFATKKSGKLSAAYVNGKLNEAVKQLGWEKHITAHILRHSFASNLIKNGVNIVHVQKLLGHSNLKVTSIYTHANMDELNNSINLL